MAGDRPPYSRLALVVTVLVILGLVALDYLAGTT